MDQVHHNLESDSYSLVDKYPPVRILDLDVQNWHIDSQKDILFAYKCATICVFVVTGFVLFGEWVVEAIKSVFIGGSILEYYTHYIVYIYMPYS